MCSSANLWGQSRGNGSSFDIRKRDAMHVLLCIVPEPNRIQPCMKYFGGYLGAMFLN